MTYAAPASQLPTPLVLSCVSRWSGFHDFWLMQYNAVVSSTTVANLAIYVPIVVSTPATFTRGFWQNGSVATNAGNACVGIYNPAGTQLATTGAVAASGNSIIQSAVLTASVSLTPGTYYMAISYSASGANGTSGFAGSGQSRFAGLYLQAVGSHPLPSPATFATWASNVVPLFGITQTSFAI